MPLHPTNWERGKSTVSNKTPLVFNYTQWHTVTAAFGPLSEGFRAHLRIPETPKRAAASSPPSLAEPVPSCPIS